MKRISMATVIMAAIVCLGAVAALQANQTSDRIESSAQKSYVFMTYLKSDNIKIHVMNDSMVTLTGTVSEWTHRSLAEETVAGLPGVVSVDDKLGVEGGQPDKNTDLWIGIKVKTMLMFHKQVSGIKTHVRVRDGVVTLRGHGSSEAQIELTTEYVKDVDGVKGVANKMSIRKPAKSTMDKVTGYVDDASITAQVRLALLFHRSTSVINTKVETADGVVTVRGVAKNAAEKDLVGKLVMDIKGVNGLNNAMTIE